MEFIITTQSANGTSFYAPHCRNNHSPEYPDAAKFLSKREVIVTAKRITCGNSLWSNQASVWADYGLESQTLIGESLNGHYTNYTK